ncbi:uncharacterized protein METZ01_LOCUS240832 [marine metagenome]|uniref:Uncharacterized protein n=1 Tax=marine metagenome TaxID=408172 RepID=A0A382HL01_9ZZZZ
MKNVFVDFQKREKQRGRHPGVCQNKYRLNRKNFRDDHIELVESSMYISFLLSLEPRIKKI